MLAEITEIAMEVNDPAFLDRALNEILFPKAKEVVLRALRRLMNSNSGSGVEFVGPHGPAGCAVSCSRIPVLVCVEAPTVCSPVDTAR